MAQEAKVAMDKQVAAHAAAHDGDIARLRALSMRQRGELIESACETAAEIQRSRRAAGLPDIQPAPWPASTWEFLRRAAARVRS